METSTSTHMAFRFVSYPEPREPTNGNDVAGGTHLTNLIEVPEWAPPQARPPLADTWSPAPTEHYESWQGICW